MGKHTKADEAVSLSVASDASEAKKDDNSIPSSAPDNKSISSFSENLQMLNQDAQKYSAMLGNEQEASDISPGATNSDENVPNNQSAESGADQTLTGTESDADKTQLGTDDSAKSTTKPTENEAQNTEEALKDTQGPAKVSRYSSIGISVAEDYVNIREKAETDADVLGKLYRGSAAKILDKKDGWYHVESGSVKGYVKSDFIKTGFPDDELIKKYGILSITVKVDGLNVREKPDMESDKLTVIYMNETYPVMEQKGDWIKVDITDDNVIGYVKSEFADVNVEFKKAVSKEEELELQRAKAEEKAKKETEIKYRDEVDYSDTDLKLLSCLVQAEAGDQTYEGKLAVANIVLNRVKSSKYPDTIKAVIYQPGQFSVAASGSLAKQLANYDNFHSNSQLLSIKAAKAALRGANNIGSRLYFHSYRAAERKGYSERSNAVKLDDQYFW
ncbi:MAG TPA: cell wall hydrolase [Mobilitalea sp.]|nr:cell wall hydrolase [Mobilitalea sp.]